MGQKRVNITIPTKLYEGLVKVAKRVGYPHPNEVICDAIREFVERHDQAE